MSIQPTAQEQYMLELINRARLNPQAEANRYQGKQFYDWTYRRYVTYDGNLNEGLPAGTISSNAKQPLAFNLSLIEQSRNHSQAVLDANTLFHPPNVIENIGQILGSNLTAANIADSHAQLFVDAGAHDGYVRGHRRNILMEDVNQIGIGIKTGNFQNGTSSIVTQRFQRPNGGNAFLTGVVYTDHLQNDDFYTIGEGQGNVSIQISGNGQTYTTTTMEAGGYQIQLAPGNYSVTFSGDLDRDGQRDDSVTRQVTIGAQNVKLDLATDTLSSSTPTPPPTTPPTTPPAGSNMNGTAEPDTLTGDAGANTLQGNQGPDKLWGRGGNDNLLGGEGNDYLIGEAGDDTLSGGAGADFFVFTSLKDGIDKITDYNPAEGDKLVFVGSDFINSQGQSSRIELNFQTGALSVGGQTIAMLNPTNSWSANIYSNLSQIGL